MNHQPLQGIAGPLVVERLAQMRKNFEEAGAGPEEALPFALFMADVCDTLGLSTAERCRVMGWRGLHFVAEWGDSLVIDMHPEPPQPPTTCDCRLFKDNELFYGLGECPHTQPVNGSARPGGAERSEQN